MTQQAAEYLAFRGKRYPIQGSPLAVCQDRRVKRRLSRLVMLNTAQLRGYTGTWTIEDGALYLSRLRMRTKHAGQFVEVGMRWLFPGCGRKLACTWYTGELVLGIGTPARAMYASAFPRHLVLTLGGGRVTSHRTRSNRRAYDRVTARGKALEDFYRMY